MGAKVMSADLLALSYVSKGIGLALLTKVKIVAGRMNAFVANTNNWLVAAIAVNA